MASEEQQSLGIAIRQAREARRLTQKQLGARVHVDAQTVSHWETGRTTPSFERLQLLSRELAVPLGELVDPEMGPALARLAEEVARLAAEFQRFVGRLEASLARTEGRTEEPPSGREGNDSRRHLG